MVCNCLFVCFCLCLSLSLSLSLPLSACVFTGEAEEQESCLLGELQLSFVCFMISQGIALHWHALTCTSEHVYSTQQLYQQHCVSIPTKSSVRMLTWHCWKKNKLSICTVVTATSDISCTCSCHLFLWARNLIILMFLEEFGSSYETIASCFFVFNLNLLWVAIPLYCPGVGCNSINYPLWGITTHCEA